MKTEMRYAAVDELPSTSRGSSLPTAPCSVVWSGGHAYVLEEGGYGRARWTGRDDRGRPQLLTNTDLQRQGWTRTRN